MICCDTSFLFSVYGQDSTSPQALAELRGLGRVLTVSTLNDFDLENSVRLAVFQKLRSAAQASVILAEYVRDMRAGRLALVTTDLGLVVIEAKRLAVTYTLTGGHRAFDVLHVASALQLGATEFLSFNGNQCRLAKAVGLKVRPV